MGVDFERWAADMFRVTRPPAGHDTTGKFLSLWFLAFIRVTFIPEIGSYWVFIRPVENVSDGTEKMVVGEKLLNIRKDDADAFLRIRHLK